ncbi:MAG: diaminopimelate epimerase [Bacteroidota bacterium]
MQIKFSKYEGTGNDFLLLNNLNGDYDNLSIQEIQRICKRRFGVGADGLIKINQSENATFYMDYHNADGSQSFCGNGARCAVHFAKEIGVDLSQTIQFDAIDGLHEASIHGDSVKLKMIDVEQIEKKGESYELYTGSPHYIELSDDISSKHVISLGRSIRFSEPYKEKGINVNVLKEIDANHIAIATYERGVEDETLSCGTGATACALLWDFISSDPLNKVFVKVKGGELSVQFERNLKDGYSNIYLIGPATKVYDGIIDL